MKVQGQFTWHRGAETEEFFLFLARQLTSQMRDRNVALAPRKLFVVLRGVDIVRAPDRQSAVLLFEPSTAVDTGDARGELTTDVDELT